MPSSKKVAWSQLKVGIMAIIALVILAALVFLLTGADNPFAEKVTLYTYLRDSAAMTEGSSVRLNGILIGKVKAIELTGHPDVDRTIRMTMQIDKNYLKSIPVDSELGFSAESVLGEKFLNIRRGTKPETMRNGGEIKARDDRDFLEIVQSAMPLLESLQSILARLDKIVGTVEAGKGSIGKLITDEQVYNRINGMLGNIQTITGDLADGKGTIGKLLRDDALYTELRQTTARLDAIAAGLEKGEGTAGKFLKDAALYNELRSATAEIRTLVADLNAGKGSAGKFLKDEALHNRLVATLDRINGTMDRLNAGQGTLGQLLVNPSLYENLTGTTGEMRGLMKDFRANPKKFLTIQLKLF
ncbi:MAG TPA: MlaD family protein [Bryobacteraceae bacterium]|nr:MlaD family protein [Bryobacteraceae bacterium]